LSALREELSLNVNHRVEYVVGHFMQMSAVAEDETESDQIIRWAQVAV
jgi:hypothetical protein